MVNADRSCQVMLRVSTLRIASGDEPRNKVIFRRIRFGLSKESIEQLRKILLEINFDTLDDDSGSDREDGGGAIAVLEGHGVRKSVSWYESRSNQFLRVQKWVLDLINNLPAQENVVEEVTSPKDALDEAMKIYAKAAASGDQGPNVFFGETTDKKRPN